jgi:hypothetical protein
MIKLFAIALTLSAFALSTSFADCTGGNGKCSKKDKDAKKEQAVQTVNF